MTAIAAGSYHTMVLTVGGGVLAFGANDTGCLGLGDCVDRWRPTRADLVLEGEQGFCIRAVQLACGAGHSIVLVSKQGCLQVRATGAQRRREGTRCMQGFGRLPLLSRVLHAQKG